MRLSILFLAFSLVTAHAIAKEPTSEQLKIRAMIQEIKLAGEGDRYEKMNAFKEQLRTMNAQARQEAIAELQSAPDGEKLQTRTRLNDSKGEGEQTQTRNENQAEMMQMQQTQLQTQQQTQMQTQKQTQTMNGSMSGGGSNMTGHNRP